MTQAKFVQMEDQLKIPRELPVLPLRDIVVYPFIIVPLSVSRTRSIKSVERALAENRMILLVAQKDADTRALEKQLSDALGIAVDIRHKANGKGEIRLRYRSLEQLDDLCRLLKH